MHIVVFNLQLVLHFVFQFELFALFLSYSIAIYFVLLPVLLVKTCTIYTIWIAHFHTNCIICGTTFVICIGICFKTSAI